MQRRFLLGLSLLLVTLPAAAHPWHGEGFSAGFAHPFLGADHLIAMIAVGLWAVRTGRRMLWAAPLAFVGAMIAGAIAGFNGINWPYANLAATVSVLAFGLMLVLPAMRSVVAGLALIAGFAVCHGLAHSAELPPNASAVIYLAGFATATAVLHASGIRVGLSLRRPAHVWTWAGAPIVLAGVWLLAQPLFV